ncbi:hypothetical protein LTR09_009169 [Extremus antarcticus]|uniref:Conserved oligomeric Golgi complex subunit 1 n=1 Tax=Extremus antarcticus TaxID=702011 RepID=A0AAJ0DG28_9PEZI|nr:hypothetical protein LTR09_009169 [Extremus antarcticus]
MAGQIPDPRSLTTWEDAFQHPLPVVRKLEQQLRRNIDDNREKLRSLVGASYRDLLGTAERIIEMDEQMQRVETTMGEIGRKCNARTVERVAENHARMRKTLGQRDGERYQAMAQTKVLQNALTMVMRIIKSGGNALQASKLLVLGRLLYRHVSESPHAPTVIEELRGKLATARKKLFVYLERVIAKPASDKTLQANSLCGYALITSSTPKEVLRYFLQTRFQQLENKSEAPTTDSMVRVLDLYSQTLLDSRDLFPRRFADTLAQLAKTPMVQDFQVQLVFELNLDVYGLFVAADIRSFTPWVRHDQVTTAEVGDALSSWTSQAQRCVLEGLQDYLSGQHDARVVFDTRQKIISKYLSLGSKVRGQSHTKAIDQIRATFLARLQEIASSAGSIDDLILTETSISSINESAAQPQKLWDLATEDFDLSHGAVKFRSAIIRNRHGRSIPLQAEIRKLDEWVARTHFILELVEEMRTSRWDNDIDFDLEDLDDHDDLLRDLNKSDVAAVTERLRDACANSLNQIVQKVTSLSAKTEHPAYFIRLWREIDRRQRALRSRLDLPMSQLALTELYRNFALSVSREPIDTYTTATRQQTHIAVTLWDGTPPLPLQPSPVAFEFLMAIQKALAADGADTWSYAAVDELKGVVAEEVSARLDDDAFTRVKGPAMTNGHSEAHDDDADEEGDNAEAPDKEKLVNGSAEKEELSRDRLLQNLFDVQYLYRVLRRSKQDDDGLGRLISSMRMTLELDTPASERLERSANEYWKRTHLLFGLLAPAQDGSSY